MITTCISCSACAFLQLSQLKVYLYARRKAITETKDISLWLFVALSCNWERKAIANA